MRSIGGFNSEAIQGSFGQGQPISASALNKLAAAADSARTMMSNDVTFTAGQGGVSYGLPQDIVDTMESAEEASPDQFQLSTVTVTGSQCLKLAKGSVTFTQSNMPRVKLGGHYDKRQGWISKVAVYGSGVMRTAGSGGSPWMEGDGYYTLTPGTYYVTVSKFDINQSNDDTESELLNAEAPWVSIFKSGDDIESTIFSETGPSEYVNKTNIHKMTGYDATSTGLSGDWGNCHTTWFNPTKWGYDVKLIGIVTVTTGTGDVTNISIDQHLVGPIDLHIPCQFNGTTLCNQDDLNEANDPYNLNKDSTPVKWANIVNQSQLSDMEELTPANTDWFQEFVGPADWTSVNYSYLIPSSCAAQNDGNESECFPFKVKDLKYVTPTEGAPYAVYNICPGTLNNIMPLIYDDVNEAWVYMDIIPQPQIALEAGTETWIVLRAGPSSSFFNDFPATTPGSPPENDPYPRIYTLNSMPPDDTDQLSYVILAKVTKLPDDQFQVDQYVTGSLWGDRIKMGTQTATYYYARI
jgi:hypothetical protein